MGNTRTSRSAWGEVMGVTAKQEHILKHSLGLTYGNKIYRNHFVTGKGSPDFDSCVTLTKAGYMTRQHLPDHGGSDIFRVTAKGKALFPNAIPDPDDSPRSE